MISSAATMVESRCAITSEVRLRETRFERRLDLVLGVAVERATSPRRASGSAAPSSTVRAIATRCFSPPESFRPRSPTWVS